MIRIDVRSLGPNDYDTFLLPGKRHPSSTLPTVERQPEGRDKTQRSIAEKEEETKAEIR